MIQLGLGTMHITNMEYIVPFPKAMHRAGTFSGSVEDVEPDCIEVRELLGQTISSTFASLRSFVDWILGILGRKRSSAGSPNSSPAIDTDEQ